MKAIITGVTGFLGRHLAEYLLQKEWQVIGFGRNEKIGFSLAEKGVHFQAVDLCNVEELAKAFESVDVVFHCAALSSVWGKYEDFYDSNVKVTENLINVCLQNKVKRFIHVSTPSLYFDYQDKLNIKESDDLPKRFANHYAKTKFLAEEKVLQAPDILEKVIIRPRGLFGEFDTSIMPRILNLLDKGVFPRFSEDSPVIDLTYVVNVAHALYLSAICPGANKQIYNISNAEPIFLEDVLNKLCLQLNLKFKYKKLSYFWIDKLVRIVEFLHRFNQKEPLLTRYSLGVLAKSQTLCIDKAKQDLGYQPLYTLEEGISRYVDWYQNQV